MDEIRLPQNVVNRFGRRWTARFAQMLIGKVRNTHPCRFADAAIRSDRRRSGGCWSDP